MAPMLRSEFLILRTTSFFISGLSAAAIPSNRQKAPSNPGTFFLEKQTSTMLLMLSSVDKSRA